MPAKPRIKVECMECGKKFQTTNDIPYCPKCGGADIEVREDADTRRELVAKSSKISQP